MFLRAGFSPRHAGIACARRRDVAARIGQFSVGQRDAAVGPQPPVHVPATIPPLPDAAISLLLVNDIDSYLHLGGLSNNMHAIDQTMERAMRGLVLNVLITGLLLWGLVAIGVG